ncbi:hypothetical protein GPNADHDJ_02233 [Stenotrophomonas maltophilia]|uniref:Nucleotidyl transferase AbiEii/AbiGii toxin family protein n=1 Tax=Stenotrophomonas maltophilia TaxID=40324 RepID=A0AAX1IGA7_STEMA|nr:nucleotidyl transferase AbiEii/AbiGii toxin family protein [Stenotrophomonas maltophilia]QNG78020.1 hypothetical protein GPNADHDJ_02233 [Stenotrophomonas maltophilia]
MNRELPAGAWQALLPRALVLIEEIRRHGGVIDPFWTLGGGTVLMFRHRHRLSKDIDIFVPNPQYLGFVTPRLSDVAASLTGDYSEDPSSWVKLQFEEGEVDFVAAPNLLDDAWEERTIDDQRVRVETSAEIIAKKMFHRGNRTTHGAEPASRSWQRREYVTGERQPNRTLVLRRCRLGQQTPRARGASDASSFQDGRQTGDDRRCAALTLRLEIACERGQMLAPPAPLVPTALRKTNSCFPSATGPTSISALRSSGYCAPYRSRNAFGSNPGTSGKVTSRQR